MQRQAWHFARGFLYLPAFAEDQNQPEILFPNLFPPKCLQKSPVASEVLSAPDRLQSISCTLLHMHAKAQVASMAPPHATKPFPCGLSHKAVTPLLMWNYFCSDGLITAVFPATALNGPWNAGAAGKDGKGWQKPFYSSGRCEEGPFEAVQMTKMPCGSG